MQLPKYARGATRGRLVKFLCKIACCQMRYPSCVIGSLRFLKRDKPQYTGSLEGGFPV